jgi:hypothetical protein
MAESTLLHEIGQKKTSKEDLAERVIGDPKLLPEVLAGLSHEKADIKYGCAKIIRFISDQEPGLLYPRIDFFIDLLDGENRILRWEAIYVLASLAAVDSENKIEKIFDKYFAPIPGPELITASNVIKAAARIVSAKPQLAGRIAKELLKVDKARYENAECRNIALGQAIKSFDSFFDKMNDRSAIVKLVTRQLKNTRSSTKKAAEEFLKKMERQGLEPPKARRGSARKAA